MFQRKKKSKKRKLYTPLWKRRHKRRNKAGYHRAKWF